MNERRTVVGVDWPLRAPPTVERDRRAWRVETSPLSVDVQIKYVVSNSYRLTAA